jgi:hypothetical protein
MDIVAADNFARWFKALKGLTFQPDRFILNPLQQMQGLDS